MSKQVVTPNKPKDTNIALYSFSDQEDNLTIIKLHNDGSYDNIPHAEPSYSLSDNLTSISIRTPDEDCILCMIYRGQPIVANVGLPLKKFIYYAVDGDVDIEYKHIKSTNGDTYSEGVLSQVDNGFYYLDIDIAEETSIVIVNEIPYLVKTQLEEAEEEKTSGSIKIQNNVWQLIAIPREGAKVKEYFVDRLAAKYSVTPDELLESCNAFFGSENKFRSYIPGVTNPTTSNNFPLVYLDEGTREITGFWVKIKDLYDKINDIDDIYLDWET